MFDELSYLDVEGQIYIWALLLGGAVSIAAAFLPHAFKVAGRIGISVLGLGMIGYAVYILQPSTTEYSLFYYVFVIPFIVVITAIVNMRNHAAQRRAAANPQLQATQAQGAPQAPWQTDNWQAPTGQGDAPAAGWPTPAGGPSSSVAGWQTAATTPAPAGTQAPAGQAACKQCGGPLPYVGAACANH